MQHNNAYMQCDSASRATAHSSREWGQRREKQPISSHKWLFLNRVKVLNHVFCRSNHSFATCLGSIFFLVLQRRTWYCSAKQWSRTPCLCVLAQFSSKRGWRNYPPLHISGYFSLKLRVITWFTLRKWTVANVFANFRRVRVVRSLTISIRTRPFWDIPWSDLEILVIFKNTALELRVEF